MERRHKMRRNEINRTCMAVRERERESKRVEKTCSAFDTENWLAEKKIININNASVKLDNIELGYERIAESYQWIVEVFIRQKCTQKQMQDKDKQKKKIKKTNEIAKKEKQIS